MIVAQASVPAKANPRIRTHTTTRRTYTARVSKEVPAKATLAFAGTEACATSPPLRRNQHPQELLAVPRELRLAHPADGQLDSPLASYHQIAEKKTNNLIFFRPNNSLCIFLFVVEARNNHTLARSAVKVWLSLLLAAVLAIAGIAKLTSESQLEQVLYKAQIFPSWLVP